MTETDSTITDAVLKPLARGWWVVLVVVVACGVVAGGVSHSHPKRYTAQAQLLFRGGTTALAPQVANEPGSVSATNQALVVLPQVITAAAHSVSGVTESELSSEVKASAAGESSLVDVDVTNASPERAATLATAVARAFVQFQSAAARQPVQIEVKRLQAAIAQLPASEAGGAYAQQLNNSLANARLQATVASGDAILVQPADIPSSPSGPRWKKAAVLAGVAGLIVSAALVLALSRIAAAREERRRQRLVGLAPTPPHSADGS